MRFLNDRYHAILEHKGGAICALKEAIPAEGDELGYVIDLETFDGKVYDHPDDAVQAVDTLLKSVESVLDCTNDHLNVDIVQQNQVVSNYDGRNSIDMAYNDYEVKDMQVSGNTMTLFI